MLLFVIDAERDELNDFFRQLTFEKFQHFFIDVFSIGKNLANRRARKISAIVSRRALADRVVITVKKKTELRIKFFIIRREKL